MFEYTHVICDCSTSSQLVVYHIRPDGRRASRLLVSPDQVDGARQHFEHNDVSFVAISRADRSRSSTPIVGAWAGNSAGLRPPPAISISTITSPSRKRRARAVSFYNFGERPDPEIDELPGVSVFYMDDDGAMGDHGPIYHTYSTYGRGGEMFLLSITGSMSFPKAQRDQERQSLRLGETARPL